MYEDDIAAARQAAASDQRNVTELTRLAERLLHAGEPHLAVRLAEEALALGGEDFAVLFAASAILGIAGDPEQALAAGQRACFLRPDSAEAAFQVGALLIRLARWPEAAVPMLRHVTLAPASAAGWRIFSAVLQENGRSQQALEAIDRAVALAPGEVEYRIHRAGLLGARGRFGDAIAVLDAVLGESPADARVLRARSAFLAVCGEMARALDDAEAAAALMPGNLEYADHLADLRAAMALPATRTRLNEDAMGEAVQLWLAPRIAPPPAQHRLPSWSRALHTQARVVMTLVLREIRTRFSHTRLGYVWAVIEPISHLFTLGVIFRLFNHAPPPVGDDLFLFYITGLIPFLVFWHVSQDLVSVLAANSAVLQMPIVRPLDAAIARALLYLATQVMVGLVVFTIAGCIGYQGMPADMLTAMAAVLALWAMATGIGLTNIVISHFLPPWETCFAAVNRLLYFASGIYYSPIFLPQSVRDVLAWNPVLQGVEWFRSGFFAQYDPPWVDRVYLLTWGIASLLLGLSLFRVFRKQLALNR